MRKIFVGLCRIRAGVGIPCNMQVQIFTSLLCGALVVLSCHRKPCTKVLTHYADNGNRMHDLEVLCEDSLIKHGFVHIYYNTGRVLGRTHYEYGKKNGPSETFHPDNGSIASVKYYDDDVVTGLYMKFTPRGDTTRIIEFKNGVPHNVLLCRTQQGDSLDCGTLQDGYGMLISYDDNDRIISKQTLVDGQPYGTSMYIRYDRYWSHGYIDTVYVNEP